MPCPKCELQPGYHSFKHIGEANQVSVFYTNPEKSKDKDEEGTKLEHVTIHVQEGANGKPWIWVLDCGTMTIADYTEVSFNYGIYNLVTSDPYLQEVWIIRPNIWIRSTIGFFQTFSYSKILQNISYIEGSNLEQLEFLETKGVNKNGIHWLIHQKETLA
jgi:hypothetical protein